MASEITDVRILSGSMPKFFPLQISQVSAVLAPVLRVL
jgi:hypothetical protein